MPRRRAVLVALVGLSMLAVPALPASAEGDACAPRDGYNPRAPEYVCALYELFLHPPTAEEVQYWLGFAHAPPQDGPFSFSELVQAFSVNEEASIHLVADLYQTYLDRPVDTYGLRAWVPPLVLHATRIEQVEVALMTSAEYRDQAGTAEGFVAAVYADVLGRTPAGAEAADWVGLLSSGTATHETVAAAILGSEEASARRAAGLYGLLGRAPSGEEVAFWAAQIRGRGFRLAQASFLGSAEAYATL